MAKMLYVVVVLLTIRQYAFVVRLDIQYFCSSSLSTNILGIGITIYLTIKSVPLTGTLLFLEKGALYNGHGSPCPYRG